MITVATWNVRYFSHPLRGIASTRAGLVGIAQALASLDPQPDIVALQEIDEQSLRSSLVRAGRASHEHASPFDRFLARLNDASLARNGHFYQAQFYPAHGHRRAGLPLISTGLALLYRHTLEQVDHNGHDPEDITHRRLRAFAKVKQRRVCAWSRFRDSHTGKSLDVFNTHLSLPSFFKRTRGTTGGRFGEADNQLAEMDSVLDFTVRHGSAERSVLVGDFNAVPGSRVYRRVTEQSHLRDAHAVHLGADAVALRRFPTAGFMHLRYRLDHVFTGAGLTPLAFPNTAPFGRNHPLAGLSDHMPIVAQLRLDA